MNAANEPNDALQPLREQIDAFDDQILALLNQRAALAVRIGKIKANDHSPTYAPDREQRVLQRLCQANPGPLHNAAVEAIYREIMSGTFALQRPLRVGYLGPVGTFSHLAAKKQFGSSPQYVAVDDIPHVFQAVERDEIDLGLVPIENSTGGSITVSHDCFLQSSVRVCAEVLIRIHHNVMSASDERTITKLYSRPEVFEQCRRWLSENLRSAELVPATSTAKAAERSASEPGAAAIGSSIASEAYKVPVLHANIEDNPNNVTRFFVIGNTAPRPSGDDKTALVFTTAHKPGALSDVLDVFREYGINLTHIDKRPSQRVNWEYYFFVDCQGHCDEPNMVAALQEVKKHCLHLTVLGSFPRANAVLE